MSVVSRAALKQYFETGDKPTEAQYIDLIDSLMHKTADVDTYTSVPDGSEFVLHAIGNTADNEDNNWKIVIVAGSLVTQKRESGVWNDKDTIIP